MLNCLIFNGEYPICLINKLKNYILPPKILKKRGVHFIKYEIRKRTEIKLIYCNSFRVNFCIWLL